MSVCACAQYVWFVAMSVEALMILELDLFQMGVPANAVVRLHAINQLDPVYFVDWDPPGLSTSPLLYSVLLPHLLLKKLITCLSHADVMQTPTRVIGSKTFQTN